MIAVDEHPGPGVEITKEESVILPVDLRVLLGDARVRHLHVVLLAAPQARDLGQVPDLARRGDVDDLQEGCLCPIRARTCW